MQSENALREGAAACFANAQDLLAEAKLLYEQVLSPRSAALALIGAEEFAKAVVFTVAALLPQQRHHLPTRLNGHELKHHICGIADGFVGMLDEGWYIEGTPPSVDRLCALFQGFASGDLRRLLDEQEAKQYYKELRREHKERSELGRHLQEDPEQDIYLSSREPDLKNAAFYVDLDGSGKVLSPTNRVEEADVSVSISSLEYFLSQYAALPTVVEDDHRWHDFAERVRNSLPDTDPR